MASGGDELPKDFPVKRPKDFDLVEFLEDKQNRVFFIGEGNFTFSTAVASFRKTWRNIIATCPQSELPNYNDTRMLAIHTCLGYHTTAGSNAELTLGIIKDIATLECVDESHDNSHAAGVNVKVVESLKKTLKDRNFRNFPVHFFFQCPWIPKTDIKEQGSTSDLILKFFRSASECQTNTKSDEYVFLGITINLTYYSEYGWEVNSTNDGFQIGGYEYLGYDEKCVKEMLGRGYTHMSYCGSGGKMHRFIENDHRTLCFKRIHAVGLGDLEPSFVASPEDKSAMPIITGLDNVQLGS